MRKQSKFLILFLAVVLVVGLLSGCGKKEETKGPDISRGEEETGGKTTKEEVKEEIKIGTIGPLTGDVASYGISTKKGVEVAVDEFNQKGGINGKPVRLISEDTRGEQTETANAASKLVERDKVTAIVGGVISSETMTAGPITNDAKVVMISSSSTAVGVPEIGDYVIRNCLSDEVQAVQLAEFAVEELGLKKFAVMFTNNDYGLSLKDAFEKRAKELAEVTGIETYNDGEKDFRTQLTKLKGKNPDALYIAGYYTEAAKIAQQAKEQGLDVAILGADGFYSPILVELGGDAVEGSVFTAGFFTDDPAENAQKFVKAFKSKFNEEPDMFAAQAYDAAMILLTAIENAGGVGGEAHQKEMLKIKDYPGITGSTSFTPIGDVVKDIIILKVENGKFTKLR
jgi:branched-chain amino acid transport system substrate-binding protein